MTRVMTALCVALWLASGPAGAGEKPPDLGKAKFKDLAKYLSLTAEQQAKIRPNVERIQDLVKRAARLPGSGGWRGGYAGGSRIGGPGDWGRRPPAGGGTDVKGSRAQREEWQTEIEARVSEIRVLLTPAQQAKFESVRIPNLRAAPGR
jgi:hypothetical protein